MLTTVSIFTAEQWAQRILKLYPNNWTSDAAKMAGGVLFSLFESGGDEFNFLENGLDWVLNACRIATAEDIALDNIATDYFGSIAAFEPTVVRQPGESDDSFRARIYANLLQSGGTRADISRVVELLTGEVPRICEPWNLMDNGACDSISFCDIDTVANPCRVGDLSLRYQGFVESVLPSFGSQGNNPVYCADVGLSCDRSFIIDPQPTWFLGEQELDLAINRVRMFSTIVWRRYGGTVTANYARGNTVYPAMAAIQSPIGINPACPQIPVVLACASWNSAVYVQSVDNGNFLLIHEVPAPGSQGVDWIAAPATLAGYGVLPVTAGRVTASLAVPILGTFVMVTPSWNTEMWLTASESSVVSFGFSVPAPPGAYLNYGSISNPNNGSQVVPSGFTGTTTVNFNNPVNDSYQLMVLPGWNTNFEIVKTNTGFSINFSTSPDTDSFFSWAVFDQPY